MATPLQRDEGLDWRWTRHNNHASASSPGAGGREKRRRRHAASLSDSEAGAREGEGGAGADGLAADAERSRGQRRQLVACSGGDINDISSGHNFHDTNQHVDHSNTTITTINNNNNTGSAENRVVLFSKTRGTGVRSAHSPSARPGQYSVCDMTWRGHDTFGGSEELALDNGSGSMALTNGGAGGGEGDAYPSEQARLHDAAGKRAD